MINFIIPFKQKRWAHLFIIYLRYLIGGAFVFSSIPKIMGERFTTASAQETPINTFPHLFETLYRSGIYWEFLGWGQLLTALLLMTQLFATLGAAAFLPVMINIFFISITYSLGAGLPTIAGLMLLANILLLIWDYHKLHILVIPESNKSITIENHYHEFFNDRTWVILGLALFVTTVIYVLTYGRNPITWFFICVTEGIVGLIYMSRKHKK